MKRSVIALITDFGLNDVYVGVMKGVMLSINPDAVIVDITHSIPRHDIAAGSYALRAAYGFFPEGTVFVIVVDPGVGGKRPIICARSGGRYFLAPDNGVLGALLSEEGYESLVRVEREDLYLKPVSSTFHGRDIFAPVAAHLSEGLDIRSLGEATADFVRVEIPEAETGREGIVADVRWVDIFGNVVTSVTARTAREVVGKWAGIAIRGKRERFPLVESYEALMPGGLLAIVGSSGFLEISVREGSAAERLGLAAGERIVLIESGEE